MNTSTDSPDYALPHAARAVYPGHPLTLAYLVMGAFDSLEAASSRKDPSSGMLSYPAALTSPSIPGAGGNVYAALDLLGRARVLGVDAAIAWSKQWWDNCAKDENFGNRNTEGQAQADSLTEAFRQKAAVWLRKKPGP